jgi:hypothetical protein
VEEAEAAEEEQQEEEALPKAFVFFLKDDPENDPENNPEEDENVLYLLLYHKELLLDANATDDNDIVEDESTAETNGRIWNAPKELEEKLVSVTIMINRRDIISTNNNMDCSNSTTSNHVLDNTGTKSTLL